MSTLVLTRTALVLAGALAAGGAFAESPAASAAPNAAAPKACTTSGCKVVAHVDVDGDGRADTVSVTPTWLRGKKARTLRVVTARKQVAQTTYPTPFLNSSLSWFGAARLDGVTGNDLVVRTGWGAHTHWFGVYSWRGGKLVAQRDPQTGSTNWSTDGAFSIMKGYTLKVSNGARTLTVRQYDRDGIFHYFTGTATTYTWRNGGWKKASSSRVYVPDSSPKVGAAYGWHVAGLPVG